MYDNISLTCTHQNICLTTFIYKIVNEVALDSFVSPITTFNAAETDRCFDTILSRRSTDNSLDFMAWFELCHALSTVGPYIDTCVPFQIMSNQLNLPQVIKLYSCTISRMISGNRMHLSSILSAKAKAVNYYVHVILFVFCGII